MSTVFTVGLHVVDMLGRPVSDIPPGQNVVMLEEIRVCIAGTAAATAVDLARLGVPVKTIGCVGNDLLGTLISTQMAAEGVDVAGLRVIDDAPTSSTILPIRPNGDRPALHVIGSTARLVIDDFPFDAVEPGDVVHIGGTFLLPGLDGAPTVELARRAKERGAVVTMDFIPHERPDLHEILLPTLPYLDFIFPNLEDAGFFASLDDRQEIARFYHELGVGCTVLTMGGDGVSVWQVGRAEILLPAFAVDVVDTSGCGDSFSAGFISGLLAGLPLDACAQRGLACGSLVATGLGSDAGLESLEQVDSLIASGARAHASWQ